MNRRDFAKSVVAMTVAPTLPTFATSTPAAQINPITYAWSAHYATLNSRISADALARRFALTPDKAEAIFARLNKAGIIAAPNAAGVAKVTRQIVGPRAAIMRPENPDQIRQILTRSEEDLPKLKKDPAKSANDISDSAERPADNGSRMHSMASSGPVQEGRPDDVSAPDPAVRDTKPRT